MTLFTDINEDIKIAMKAKDKERLSVLRMIKASLQNEGIKKGGDLSPEDELSVLTREKKQRNESLEEFEKAGRNDLSEPLKREILIVDEYLPAQLSEEEIRDLVEEAVIKTGASSTKDMGKVMAALMPETKGKADGKLVSRLVKEKLQ